MTLRLALTPGEPAGIGPDLLIKLVQHGSPHELIAITDPDLLESRARLLNLPLRLREPRGQALPASELAIMPIPMPAPCHPGRPDTANASFILETLNSAVNGCRVGDFEALVTGPVNKAVINDAGIPFSGHTEYLAELSNTPRVVMMLATHGLRVALATTHLPLSQVSGSLNRPMLREILRIIDRDLKGKFAITTPRILVCGLNPHAGEGGHLGHEEIDIISPVIEELRDQGLNIRGPTPADTAFTRKCLDDADVVVAMYHDQGLPVLKYRGFGAAVNITLGLPFIRASVDHGTALELAGTGNIDTGSLAAAIAAAAEMAGSAA
ncbi:MAG TPA: 4-hydroxythreonine-4-phosphate dehydrogenase PdxA [Porticoccaceae bacterium]|nr:4-hydroxythreonine-4-phosphate dehydrogenase PdxA [Porticoccaceae bacterium]HCO59292.1 4-hydroxythreonine-4-phosphate dehydrogenase PdxA [Porticoccaceae bacterium]